MLKFLAEFGPIVAFFIGYNNYGVLTATLYMLIASVVGVIIIYVMEKKINMINIVSSGLLLISSSLTLFSGNSVFIKMKPTVLYIIFALIFFITNFKWQPATQVVFGKAISFKEEAKWRQLNVRFILFFIGMAMINEIIWRNFPEETWVNFKVFGTLPISLLFMFTQMPFIVRNKVET